MTIATNKLATKPMTLEEYLDYEHDTDAWYELVDGIVVEMSAESYVNIVIGTFLLTVFSQLIPQYRIHRGTEIAVSGTLANTRVPDAMVISKAGARALQGKKRSLITFDMPAPELVVEVVSNSDADRRSRQRDYVDKQRQYAQRNIAEYWIIDPIASVVLILNLTNQTYQEQKFVGDEKLISSVLPDIDLTVSQIMSVGDVD